MLTVDPVQSARQPGTDKRVTMWQPDSHVGMVVLQAPPMPKIKHPIPIIKRFEVEEDKRRRSEVDMDMSALRIHSCSGRFASPRLPQFAVPTVRSSV